MKLPTPIRLRDQSHSGYKTYDRYIRYGNFRILTKDVFIDPE